MTPATRVQRQKLNYVDGNNIEPKVIPHQAEACESAEAEPSYPSVDSSEDWKHHQVNFLHRLVYLWREGRGYDMIWEIDGNYV